MRSLARLLLLACLALLALPPVSSAGDYAVRLTSTTGPHWSSHGRGPFIGVANRVYSGRAYYAVGDYQSWRAGVVGTGSTIIGGTMRIGIATPNAAMRARIVAGAGATPVVVYDGVGTGNVERGFSGAYDWVQFDLRSAAATSTTTSGDNSVQLGFLDLTLRDSVPPTLGAIALPDPGRWHAAHECIPFAIQLADQGGGLLRAQVRRASDGAVITQLSAPQSASTRPGPAEQQLSDCVQRDERGHGDTTFIATVWDVGGAARELAFSVRADHLAPVVSGGPPTGTRFAVNRPSVTFEVADQGTGLHAVAAQVDGSNVPVTLVGGVATIQTGELARGTHVIAFHAGDWAGNATLVQRTVSVVDERPPTIALTAPGARGGPSPALRAVASDDMSGVDPARWRVTVDDARVAFRVQGDVISAALGPLQVGTHTISIWAADRVGNPVRVNHVYTVAAPELPPKDPVVVVNLPTAPTAAAATPAPQRNGVVLVDGPRAAVAHGRTATVTVQVVRGGVPLADQVVEARRDGVTVATGLSDDDGVARVRFVASQPGRYTAVAAGLGFEPLDLRIAVAPRLVITTSTLRPRVGQRVRVSGRITPAIRGRRVAVEARVGGVWFPIRRAASTNGDGRFTSHVVAMAPGAVGVRVRLLAVGAWAPATSNQRVLRVRR